MFLNLCDGAYDEERAGGEVVEALERWVASTALTHQVLL